MTSYSSPLLKGFLSDHTSQESVVSITTEPNIIYFEDARNSTDLNFDFIIRGLTDKKLIIKFIKVALYDEFDALLTFKHLNHNGVGTPGIHTIGKFEINGKEVLDVFNPFHSFPKEMKIDHLRYMFTFSDSETKNEYYYGNIVVKPVVFHQKVELAIPVKGMSTILDGHDFYSHHRRFAMSVVRQFTNNVFSSNFSRYAIDFTIIGTDGNTRRMVPEEFKDNYDFHFTDVKQFYTHETIVYSPANGEIVEVVNDLNDLYDTPFNMDRTVQNNSLKEIAGNYIIIKHNNNEFSHLFHLLKQSIEASVGQKVKKGQAIAKIGFSGAATTYSHLHYQLMDGEDFLIDNPLPCKFSDVTIIQGKTEVKYDRIMLDTGDFILAH